MVTQEEACFQAALRLVEICEANDRADAAAARSEESHAA